MSFVIKTPVSSSDWDELIAKLPGAHVLQSFEWGLVKRQTGWKPIFCTWRDEHGEPLAAALVLERKAALGRVPSGMQVLYVPRGPLLDWGNAGLRRQVLADLVELTHRRRAIFIKIDPDVRIGMGIPTGSEQQEESLGQDLKVDLQAGCWRFSQDQIQFFNTMLIDLRLSEDELLSRMKQKARYNVRIAERKGVRIRAASPEDFQMLFRMYAETSIRDDFTIRDENYYLTAWTILHKAGMALSLIAEVAGEPVAGLIVYHFAGTAWYMHGMSRSVHREKMPNHLLQWETMRRLKALNIHTYDLWGAPAKITPDDPMWGVYRFKESLGGTIACGLGAWDYPRNTLLYRIYTQMLPKILDVMRWRGEAGTRRVVGV